MRQQTTFSFFHHILQTNRFAQYKAILLVLLCLPAFQISSNDIGTQGSSVLDKVIPLGDEYQNSIEILNNRFRIDSDVEAVTIVFFREFGSAPIVLVRPDGSKLYIDNDPTDDSYDWFETDTYDMIALSNPMPGPWQAVGEILPESRVMVIAGITLNADPIPSPVFSGETLKQTAYLENAGNRIDMSSFRDVVSLSIDFVSTNNTSFPNFGLGSSAIATFKDDGAGFDEYQADGTFTGQYVLDVSEGEWRPIFTVRTPLFSREQVTDNIVLLPNPIQISHEVSPNLEQPHVLKVDVDREHIDIESLLVDGTIRMPNGDIERFSVTEPSDDTKSINITPRDYGIHKMSVRVFGKTRSGRDVVINAPEYSFLSTAPVLPDPNADAEDAELLNEELTSAIGDDSSSSFEQSQDKPFPLALAIGINLTILVLGSLFVIFLVDKRNHPNNHYFLRLKAFIKRKRKSGLVEQQA